jgi:dihydroflavonol-4-reductase
MGIQSVLVTGASGFIGGHLAEALVARGCRVRCLVRASSRTERLRTLDVELVQGDVGDADSLAAAVRGVDTVFHVAGLTCALRRDDLFRVNADGPRRVAEACRQLESPPRHVLVSSVAASGPAVGPDPRREDETPRPVSQYGRSKLAGEQAARCCAADVPTTVVRPGVVFGAHDPGMHPLLKMLYQLRVHINAGFSSPPLSVISVHDLVDILWRAAETGERLPVDGAPDPGHGIYFGVLGQYPTYVQLGDMLARELLAGRRHLTLRLPSPLIWLLGAVNEAVCRLRQRPDIFNLDKVREALVPSWACSAEKTTRQLGFTPSAPLPQQLEETARWWLQQRTRTGAYSSV